MLIRQLLIKFYLLLVISAGALGFAADYFLQQENHNKLGFDANLAGVFYTEQLLINSEKSNWNKLTKQIKQQLNLNVSLLEMSDINSDQLTIKELEDGKIVTLRLSDKDIYLKKLTNEQEVIQLEVSYTKQTGITWVVLFYLLLALPLILWFWPLARDLRLLEKATIEISKNNFSFRIKSNGSSSIKNVINTFNQMAKRIEYLIEEQRSLTSAVSHEIRTPLARLKFALELQKQNVANSQSIEQFDAMTQDVAELSHLVEEILSYAKLEQVELAAELQNISAQPWLENVLEECKKSNSEINIIINCQLNEITIDPHLMARALSNLVLNAFRYAKNEIIIELKKNEKGICLSVSDDGLGVPEEAKERVFEPFAKVEKSRTEHRCGHGLGLAIVKRIAEKHGGTVKVEQAKIGGAIFSIEF